MANKEPETELSFEQALKDLESIVDSLETGDVPLAELMQKYEHGTKLLETCRQRLTDAELKIQSLEKSKDGFALGETEVHS